MPRAHYLHARGWRNLIVEADAIWRSRRLPPVVDAPLWHIDPEELHTLAIRWPSSYQWEPFRWAADPIRDALAKRVEVQIADIPQPYDGIVLLQFRRDGRWRHVAIDLYDYSFINEECARQVVLYFKLQHLREGYGLPHVVPGGYVPERAGVYRYLGYLRELRDQRRFAYEVYGRFSPNYASDVRRRAVTMLNEQNEFSYEGGLSVTGRTSFLKEVARSRICIDLPGNGAFCHRLVEYMAVGACIISPPHPTVLNEPLVPGEHIVYTRPDMSDLVELSRAYLADAEAVERLCRNSRRFFDRCLHRDSLAAYYLRTYLDHVAS
jgi:hypothetical protein